MSSFAEISILFEEGIIIKISYERRAYESVDEKSWKTTKNKNLVLKGLEKMIISKAD